MFPWFSAWQVEVPSIVTTKTYGPPKSMQVNDRNNLVTTKFRFFSKMAMEVNILTANFTILVNCAIQNYFSCQLSLKAQKESRHYS